MPLPKKYDPGIEEPRLQAIWDAHGVYRFDAHGDQPVYSIDTPPPTVSGKLHLGHTYSYTHTDIFARFHRMLGENVFYPMGFDDNGLPTERLVEKELGARASEVDLQDFIAKCQEVSERVEAEYRTLWNRMGLSIDWSHSYRTIDRCSRLTSQLSFIELYKANLIYRQEAPVIWCPECSTAISQADVDDLERESELVTLPFVRSSGEVLPIATTRPELLPACVAIFIHPTDGRYAGLQDESVKVPIFNHEVPVLVDPAANPEKGTGAVMCCTFGDMVDKHWWYSHRLDYIKAIDAEGKMTAAAGEFAGLAVSQARMEIKQHLEQYGQILDRQATDQVVPVHERCSTPVEILMSQQWFIRLMDHKQEFLAASDAIEWHPSHMKNRYQSWVDNLAWDWCISRQRYYGIHFPLWYCRDCGEVILAEESQLPLNPLEEQPLPPCSCGSSDFIPETDILETWATSSMTPQIAGRWLCEQESEPGLFERVYPYSLRPQGHEIIRTWAFYTIAKSHFHHNKQPWDEVAISGWGLAGDGMSKISKSKGGGPMSPQEMIARYSADAVRYWAASTGLGKDAVISEEKIRLGGKLTTKLWNVARFSERFIDDYSPPDIEIDAVSAHALLHQTPADRWILSRLQGLITRVTKLLEKYDYAPAKSDLENFFWNEFADNYLEMCKQRLYAGEGPGADAARYTLYSALKTICQLFAPYLPFVTEAIYQGIFARKSDSVPERFNSIHLESWPDNQPHLQDDFADQIGEIMVDIATGVRRYKSENNLSLGTELQQLHIATGDSNLLEQFLLAREDLISITRARELHIHSDLEPGIILIAEGKNYQSGIKP